MIVFYHKHGKKGKQFLQVFLLTEMISVDCCCFPNNAYCLLITLSSSSSLSFHDHLHFFFMLPFLFRLYFFLFFFVTPYQDASTAYQQKTSTIYKSKGLLLPFAFSFAMLDDRIRSFHKESSNLSKRSSYCFIRQQTRRS